MYLFWVSDPSVTAGAFYTQACGLVHAQEYFDLAPKAEEITNKLLGLIVVPC